MLDLLPSLSSRPKSSDRDRPKSAGSDSRTVSGSSDGSQDSKLAYHSDGDQDPYSDRSRVAGKITKRRMKRGRKPMEHMSPIVERSSNSSRSDAELDVIREYGIRRSLTMPIFPRIEFNGETPREEDEVEYNTGAKNGVHGLSDFAGFARSESLTLDEQHTHVAGLAPAMIRQQFRELSQQADPEELMETEGALLHILGNNETERAGLAAQQNRMREEHAAFKAEFEKATATMRFDGDGFSDKPDTTYANGLGDEAIRENLVYSPKSDFDSGFESDEGSIHVAQAIPLRSITAGSGMVKVVEIRRVTPGMVKTINIPPKNPKRYEKPVDIDFAEVQALNAQYRADLEREASREKVGTSVSATVRPNPRVRGGRVSSQTRSWI